MPTAKRKMADMETTRDDSDLPVITIVVIACNSCNSSQYLKFKKCHQVPVERMLRKLFRQVAVRWGMWSTRHPVFSITSFGRSCAE